MYETENTVSIRPEDWEEDVPALAGNHEETQNGEGQPLVDEDGWPLRLEEDGKGETQPPLTDEDGWPLTLMTEETVERPGEPEGLKVTYMGEEKALSRQEAVTLAQKGLNYDRMLSRGQEAQEALKTARARLEQLEQLLRSRGESPDELLDRAAAEEMAGRTGQSIEECTRQVRGQRLLSGFDHKLQQMRGQMAEKELESFRRVYPQMKSGDIPESVWQAVNRGEALLGAYQSHELQRLREENARLRQEESRREQEKKNRSHSMKSQRSAGESRGYDAFDALWYNGE